MRPRPRETKRAAKKNRILNEVFQSGGCLRFDLARRLNIHATMAGNYVDEWLKEGLLLEEKATKGPRRRASLQINGAYGCFLGLDFEALRARTVLCDFAGKILAQKEIPFRGTVSRETVLKKIVALARRLAEQADRPLLSVGVAAPGQVDCQAGRVLHYRSLPDFDQVPVRDRFEAVFDVPVFVEDNIRAVTYAEWLRGSAKGSRNFVCLAVRSGVGMGVMIDGRLYAGTNSMGGNVGHLVFSTAEGPKLANDLVSAKSFVESTLKVIQSRRQTEHHKRLLKKGTKVSLSDMVAEAEAGDALLRERLERLGTHLGMLAANLANLFAPEKIVLAGEVPNCSQLVRQRMERVFRHYTVPPILTTAYLEDGSLGDFAGALGVAWMGFARRFPVSEQTLSSPDDPCSRAAS